MQNIKKIVTYSKPLYKQFVLSSFLLILTSISAIVTPFITRIIVDSIETGTATLNSLIFWSSVILVIMLLNSLVQALSNRLGDFIASRLKRHLMEGFYEKILSLPQSYFDSEISGKISNQLTRGIEVIKGFSNTATNFIIPSVIQSVLIITILAYQNIYIGFFVLALFPIYIYLTQLSTKKWGKHEEEKNQYDDTARGRINEVLANTRLVKSFTNELQEYNLISGLLDKSNNVYDKQSSTFHKLDFLRNVSLSLIVTVINIISFYNAFTGAFSFGDVVFVFQMVVTATYPLFGMSWIMTQIQAAESGSKEFFEIMELESKEDIHETDKEVKFIAKDPIIEFKNVEFAYKDSNNVLENISFTIKHPQTVGLVGHSGAGKSTIINLIMKFYENTGGEIIINGKNYNSLSPFDIRKNISLVFQDNELFSSTIRENVAYGKDDASEEEIIDALEKANAWEFVKTFKDKLDTRVGERGLKLSGGQKQRIQIARAILKNAPILILDEATSSLDSVSESKIQEALDLLMKDKLVIIIAHRFSTIQNVDKLIVIDQGKISDMGTPKELIKKDGIYSELLRYQADGNKKLLKEFEIYGK
jgi:ATP-binding cassette subfamily B protein